MERSGDYSLARIRGCRNKMEHANIKKPHVKRVLLIGMVCVALFAVGHYGRRIVHRRATGSHRTAHVNVPHPPQSERLPAGAVSSDAHRTFERYRSQLSKDDIILFYEVEMPNRGWTSIKDGGIVDSDGAVLAYSNKRGDWCTISITEAASGATVGILRACSSADEQPTSGSHY